jgi:hypothetical protein
MARDIYHDAVKEALIKDGWQITHDPFAIPYGDHNLFVDLGAEKLIAAEKPGRKIAVEVKSFISRSPVDDLENALGQYLLYRSIMRRREADRTLYLAVPVRVFGGLLNAPIGQLALEDYELKLLVFNYEQKEITQWINA